MATGKRRLTFGETNIWPGFTDVISSMILVLIFVITVYAVMQAELSNILGGKQQAILRLENQLEELRALFGKTKARSDELERRVVNLARQLAVSEEERKAAQALGADSKEKLSASEAEIEALTKTIQGYLAQLEALNRKLQLAENARDTASVRADELMARLATLQKTIDELEKQVSDRETELAQKGLTMADLYLELDKKNKEIEELRRMEKYRSEFLASLRDIFEGNPNIQVVGDRFIFQAEVLFASGSDSINEAGKQELKKFVAAFDQIKGRIPRSLDLNIQVQGHTDTDKIVNTDRFASNWELSTARATQVLKYFISQGIPPNLLSAAGYSEYYPRVPGDTPEAKAMNRRIEIKFTTP